MSVPGFFGGGDSVADHGLSNLLCRPPLSETSNGVNCGTLREYGIRTVKLLDEVFRMQFRRE